jgi:hypothetical protein
LPHVKTKNTTGLSFESRNNPCYGYVTVMLDNMKVRDKSEAAEPVARPNRPTLSFDKTAVSDAFRSGGFQTRPLRRSSNLRDTSRCAVRNPEFQAANAPPYSVIANPLAISNRNKIIRNPPIPLKTKDRACF